MRKPLDRLKKRWKVKQNWEIGIILIVFAVTGSSTMYLYGFIKGWMDISAETPWWLRTIAFVFIALPLYNLLLIFWGILMGQGAFFLLFVRKFMSKIFPFLRKP
ncbi:MAG TPA: prolipoprotein diacylglyceryl transferase [Saprospiraceae bacterium]|nr:prolipoprotein diacylglyceryl transferase [Saprospiraceae bacterium]